MKSLDLQIPYGVFPPEQQRVLNEVVDRIQEAMRDPGVDAGGARVTNVGEPTRPTDALTLAAADRRYKPLGTTETVLRSTVESIILSQDDQVFGDNDTPVTY